VPEPGLGEAQRRRRRGRHAHAAGREAEEPPQSRADVQSRASRERVGVRPRSAGGADDGDPEAGQVNRTALAGITAPVSAADLEHALKNFPQIGTLVKSRPYRQVWRFEHDGKPYYLKFY